MNGRRGASPRARQLGVSPADYERMLADQDGHCALCPATPKARRFAVHHHHKTGAVLGLLCYPCNRVIPHYKDADWFERAAKLTRRGELAPVSGRPAEMRALRDQGESLQTIADRYGITRQRVHQIIGGAS